MKKFVLHLILLVTAFSATGQVIEGLPKDSVSFSTADTAFQHYYYPDTAAVPLWQIGRTTKSFFTADTSGVIAIMTDTLNYYRTNADNYFVLDLPDSLNTIISFWHHYETDSGRDGGTVEYSIDGGLTWENIVGDCHTEEESPLYGICTDNFYHADDTLTNGVPAFSGSRHGQFSRLQFYKAIPVLLAFPSECPERVGLLRFRFISDTTSDTLAGWMIDSVKIEYDNYYYGGSVHSVPGDQPFLPFPNPSTDGRFVFPALHNQMNYTIVLRDAFGSIVFTRAYAQQMDFSQLPPGLYFFSVSDSVNTYSGKIVLDN
jgi:hypothetical protein